MDEAAKLTAMIVVASFGIERVATGVFFLLSFVPQWDRAFPNAVGANSEKNASRRAQLVYFTFVGVLALYVVASVESLRILKFLLTDTENPRLDVAFTTMVLMGGADRVAELLKSSHSVAAAKPPPKPIEITGTIRLDDSPKPPPGGG